MPGNEKSPSYDAFLSYAHEDEETVTWLNHILSTYWVPGFRKRKIFQDLQRVTAASLDQQILGALYSSRFLIVCFSEATRHSEWVHKEVEEFLQTGSSASCVGR